MKLRIRFGLLCFVLLCLGMNLASAKEPVIDSLKAILDTAKANRLTAILQLANAYTVQGELQEAMSYYTQLKKESEKQDNSKLVFSASNNMAIVLMQMGQHKEAKKLLSEAYQLAVKKNLRNQSISALINIGNACRRIGDADSAIYAFRQAHQIMVEIGKNDTSGKLNILIGMAQVYVQKKQYQIAYDSLTRSLPEFNAYLNNHYTSINAFWAGDYLHTLALASDQMGFRASADSLMQQAIQLSNHFKMKKILCSCYQALSAIEENRKNYKKSLKYYKKYGLCEDTLTDSARVGQIAKLSAKFNLQKKDIEIEELNTQQKIQKLLFALIGVLFVALLIIGMQNLKVLRLKIAQKQSENKLVYENLALSNQEKQQILKMYENQASQLHSFTLMMVHQKETWLQLDQALSPDSSPEQQQGLILARSKIKELVEGNQQWDEFRVRFEHIYPSFFPILQTDFPSLTTSDLRLCALILLHFSSKQIASLLGIAVASVEIKRYRLSRKLRLAQNPEALNEFLSKRK